MCGWREDDERSGHFAEERIRVLEMRKTVHTQRHSQPTLKDMQGTQDVRLLQL